MRIKENIIKSLKMPPGAEEVLCSTIACEDKVGEPTEWRRFHGAGNQHWALEKSHRRGEDTVRSREEAAGKQGESVFRAGTMKIMQQRPRGPG